MDADIYSQAIQYEHLVRKIYQEILSLEGDNTTEVKHNLAITGRSGVEHQVDVLWRFKKGGIEHLVLIECKNYNSALTLEKVRSFFAVIHDIGNCTGIMVTKTGYQSGAKIFAEHYGINLKILGKPKEEDWHGRVKDICVDIIAKQVVSNPDKPLRASFVLGATDVEQQQRIKALETSGRLAVGDPSHFQFYNERREPFEEEFGWWLPGKLEVISKDPGGPYRQEIILENKWILVNPGDEDEELIPVPGVIVDYYVEEHKATEVLIHGEEIIEAILKNATTGEIEHFQRFNK